MKFGTSIPVHDPSKKAHPPHKIQMFLDAERHEFWEHHNHLSLQTRESSTPAQEDRNFEKMHSLTSAKMPTNKESICFSRISHFLHHDSNALINPIQHQQTNHFWEHLVTPFSNFADQL